MLQLTDRYILPLHVFKLWDEREGTLKLMDANREDVFYRLNAVAAAFVYRLINAPSLEVVLQELRAQCPPTMGTTALESRAFDLLRELCDLGLVTAASATDADDAALNGPFTGLDFSDFGNFVAVQIDELQSLEPVYAWTAPSSCTCSS